MSTTRADLTHGRYVQELEFTVREAIEVSAGVAVFAAEDTGGERFLVAFEANSSFSLEVGDEYRIVAGLGVDPAFDEQAAFAEQFAAAEEHGCPRCDGELTFETGLESPPPQVLDVLGDQAMDGCHLVVTADSELYYLSGGDDWRPFDQSRRRENRDRGYRCVDCGLSIPDGDLDRALERDDGFLEEQFDNGEMLNQAAPTADASASVGMATGGAKDVDNFRENVAEGYLPSEDALSYEGLFYDYYFDTGDDRQDRDSLFYPSYSTAVSEDPLESGTEHYLTVGLNSTLGVEDFQRRRLNLVAVLDVSGSMGSQFDQYYYDEHGQRREVDSTASDTKIEAATESLAALTTHLEADDRFGVVLYNSQAHVAKPVSRVGDTDMDAIRGHIRDVTAGGGTNMSAGLESAIDSLESYDDADPTEVENRIVFMTDMMPNTGATGRNTISGTVAAAADRGIYTTFVGMGLDENPELAAELSDVRGANHYFVHSAEEFTRRLDDEFEYMVTPLVFDLQLELDGDVDVEAAYGNPNADTATGQLTSVATLFPSPTSDGETRGGVVLLELAEEPSEDLELVASWEEIDETVHSDRVGVTWEASEPEWFQNSGIQKAVCLARYGRELRAWIREVGGQTGADDWQPMEDQRARPRSEWEHESTPVRVPEDYRERFETLQAYIEETAATVDDETLQQEVELLETLVTYEGPPDPTDLSEQAIERLRVLVELAPTSNGELAEAWGLDSGSAAHAYLESELDGFYRRDENRRLRPTKRALEVIRTTS